MSRPTTPDPTGPDFSVDDVTTGPHAHGFGTAADGRAFAFRVRGKTLRLSGAFGPLQSGAVTATMTFALKPEGQGTILTVTYVVGGFHPAGLTTLAEPVDGVIAAQMPGLKAAAVRAE